MWFRSGTGGTVLVASTTTAKPASRPCARFYKRTVGFGKARKVLTGENLSSLATLALRAKTAVVLERLR